MMNAMDANDEPGLTGMDYADNTRRHCRECRDEVLKGQPCIMGQLPGGATTIIHELCATDEAMNRLREACRLPLKDMRYQIPIPCRMALDGTAIELGNFEDGPKVYVRLACKNIPAAHALAGIINDAVTSVEVVLRAST